MELKIDIDNNEIERLVTEMIAKSIFNNKSYESRECEYGIRRGIEISIKEYIYSKKDSIIERVVDRASKEIVRKGLPKLLNNIKECE